MILKSLVQSKMGRIALSGAVAGIVMVAGSASETSVVQALGASSVPRLVAGGGSLGHGASGSAAVCPSAPGCAGTQEGRVTYPLGMAIHPVTREFYFSQGARENNADLSDQFRSIRYIDASGNLQTVIGDNSQVSTCSSNCDGAVTTSSQQLTNPGHMVFNAAGTELYVLDGSRGIRKVTFSGSPARPSSISTLTFSSLPTGFSSAADLTTWGGLALDSNGDLYFGGMNSNASGDYHRSVFKRSASGVLTELFTSSGANGTTQLNGGGQYDGPNDIKLVNGKLYIAFTNKIVRSSLAGAIEANYTLTGSVKSVAVIDSTVYAGLITDGVVKSFSDNAPSATPVTPSLTTYLGSAAQTFAIGNSVASVELTGPRSMMVDSGNLYIADMKTMFSAIIAIEAPPAVAPSISGQPNSATKTVGDSVSFSVTATSSDGGTLSYQWKKNGSDISGATSSTFTINSLLLSDAGSYSVVVTNTTGGTSATTTSSSATLAVNAPTTTTATTTTTVPASTGVAAAPTLVTSANQSALEAEPGEAVAVINGQTVAVETVKVETGATPAAMWEAAKEIVAEITKLLPAGASNDIKVMKTDQGAELTGLMTNPDDPTEKLSVPVESVTLVKAGNSAVLISALNQTNLPAEVVAGGEIQVTRGGLVAARAYGLPGSETGEIVLMSTPRLLQRFTVSANGTYNGQVPLPKDISFGSHTVVMATANAKVSLGIKLVRTKMQFRIKRVIATTIFKNRAGVKKAGGKITITGAGRCKATTAKVTMSAKAGRCFITVKQAAKGKYPAVFYRFTVQVVTKLIKPKKK